MAQIHDQLASEGIVKEGMGSLLKGKRAAFGRLYVTKQRVVFLQSSPLLGAFGALGAGLMMLVKPTKLGVEVPLSSVTSVERGKYGMNKNVIDITTSSGETVRIAAKPYEEFAAAIQPAA